MKIFTKITLIIILLLVGAGSYEAWQIYQTRGVINQQRQTAKYEEVSITLLPGWTAEEQAVYLSDKGLFPKDEYLAALERLSGTDYYVLASKPKDQSAEGYVYPDTYRLPKSPVLKDVFDRSFDNLNKKLATLGFSNQDFSKDIAIQGFDAMTFHQILTLASIVEKETSKGSSPAAMEEKRKVAGVFLNRLKIGQALESDATVNYITKKDKAAPALTDLAVESAYNTYKHAGLPPGPICTPSITSIKALLEPASTDYFYFLHDQKTGEAYFSTTFEEHVKAKLQHLK